MMTEGARSHPCPECGQGASGNFCQHCGASLGGRFCSQCGTAVAPGAKFCSECGAKVFGAGAGAGAAGAGKSAPTSGGGAVARKPRAAASAGVGAPDTAARRDAASEVVGGQNLPWWIAGAAMFGLIVVIGLQMVRPGPGPVPNAGSATGVAPAGGGVPPDISQMSPIEAADRLSNRVMTSVSQGDSAAAQQFLPMAIGAYNRARPLSLDGLFHLSMLNRTANNLEAALDNAVEILDADPDHLLGLAAAAEASIELGELDAAEAYYRHLLEVYDAEVAQPLQEYSDHSTIVDVLEADAERFLAGRG